MGTTRKLRKEDPSITSPPTGVSERGRRICVIIHLHGISEEKIRIDLERTQLIVSASQNSGMVVRKVTVPEGSRISGKKFRDGILEITLERPL